MPSVTVAAALPGVARPKNRSPDPAGGFRPGIGLKAAASARAPSAVTSSASPGVAVALAGGARGRAVGEVHRAAEVGVAEAGQRDLRKVVLHRKATPGTRVERGEAVVGAGLRRAVHAAQARVSLFAFVAETLQAAATDLLPTRVLVKA